MSAHDYRRRLSSAEQLPLVGVAVAAGLGAFYLARMLMQRARLEPQRDIVQLGPDGDTVALPPGPSRVRLLER